VYFTTSKYYTAYAKLQAEFESARVRNLAAGRIHSERDEAMTNASDYDILRYLTNEERVELFGGKYRERVSGTELNERQRTTLSASCF
jgi:hypothetical protein